MHFARAVDTLPATDKISIATGLGMDESGANDLGLPSIVSINLCADQLLILLAEPKQILSLSHLSHEAAGSYFFQQALSYPVNNGTAEQVLALKPDRVIAGEYGAAYTVQLLREQGLIVEVLPVATSIDSMLTNLKLIARWINQEAKGAIVINSIKQRLNALDPPVIPRPRAAVYDPNGYTVGDNSIRGQALTLAGWHNVATERGIESYGSLPLENLLALAPDALIDAPYSSGTYSRAQAKTQHPALQRSGLNPRIIHLNSNTTICAGPWTIDVIEKLLYERKLFQAELK